MSNYGQPAQTKNRDSFIRWQGRTIEQLGYALNVILSLSVATLGFEMSILLSKEFEKFRWQNCLFISVAFLILSVALGIFCTINRLRDFRITTDIARKRENDMSDPKLTPLRKLSCTLGKRTWVLFWSQIMTFGIGVLLLIMPIGFTIIARRLTFQ